VRQGLRNGSVSVRPSCSLSPLSTASARAAGLLLWARRAGDTDPLLHGRRPAAPRSTANASSATLTAGVRGWLVCMCAGPDLSAWTSWAGSLLEARVVGCWCGCLSGARCRQLHDLHTNSMTCALFLLFLWRPVARERFFFIGWGDSTGGWVDSIQQVDVDLNFLLVECSSVDSICVGKIVWVDRIHWLSTQCYSLMGNCPPCPIGSRATGGGLCKRLSAT